MRNVALLLAALAALALAFLLGRGSRPQPAEVVREVRDTLYLRDTLEVEVAAAPCYIVRRDTVQVAVTEWQIVHDTIYAALERTSVRYEDSTFTAVVSGIQPRLDTLQVYPLREVVTIHTTERAKASRWSIGVQAGAGIMYAGGTIHAGPYLGAGVTFRF